MKAEYFASPVELMQKIAIFLLGTIAFQGQSFAQGDSVFQTWLAELRAEAESRNYSRESIDLAFSEINEPLKRIVTNDRNQAEVVETYSDYLSRRVTDWKQTNGKKRMIEHQQLLNDIAAEYKVQPRFIVSIWGMETNFGTFPISEPLFSSLATLAFDPRRAGEFRAQFFSALTILDSGFPPYEKMKSSWAGAMGQSQFMPSSYLQYAVDQDKDGIRDIWGNEADVLASIANYFSSLGWRNDQTWGRAVRLPAGSESNFAGNQNEGLSPPSQCGRYRSLGAWKGLQEWQALGVRRPDGSDLPLRSIPAALVLADSKDDKAYIVYQNFCTIMRYNPAFKYALSIGLMSDLISED